MSASSPDDQFPHGISPERELPLNSGIVKCPFEPASLGRTIFFAVSQTILMSSPKLQ